MFESPKCNFDVYAVCDSSGIIIVVYKGNPNDFVIDSWSAGIDFLAVLMQVCNFNDVYKHASLHIKWVVGGEEACGQSCKHV